MKRRPLYCTIILIILAGCTNYQSKTPGVLEIHDLQGCSHISPFEGDRVTGINGIVTSKETNGFIMQSENPDEKDCSSEAIFVFTRDYPKVAIADLVSVDGVVTEYISGKPEDHNLSQTEITNPGIKTIESGQKIPEPLLIGSTGIVMPSKVDDDNLQKFEPENDAIDAFEALEWMLVRLPESTVIDPRNSYNEIVIAENTPAITNQLSGDGVYSLENLVSIPSPIMVKLPVGWDKQMNVGDVISDGSVGTMQYSFGSYKIVLEKVSPILELEETVENEQKPDIIQGLRIVSYNVHNFSFQNQSKKLKTLAGQIAKEMDSPDLIVLQEVEDDSGEADDGTTSAKKNLDLLIAEIKKRGGDDYQYYDFPIQNNSTGGIPGGNIRTIFLVKKNSSLKLFSSYSASSIPGEVVFDREQNISFSTNPMEIGLQSPAFENSRRPIVGLFNFNSKQIIVIGVHLISHAADSPRFGNIQPPLLMDDDQRRLQVEYIREWTETIFSQNPDIPILVIGDFNDAPGSTSLSSFMDNGFSEASDLLSRKERFSIIEDGYGELFDHVLISGIVDSNNASFRIIHLNTLHDEESSISDHDPIEFTFRP